MEFTREQAINIAIRCAKEYKRKLSNTRLFVVYRDRESNNIMALEVLFRPSNFQHLTGLIMVDENGQEKKGCAKEFYNRCLSKPFITSDEIRFKNDGTTLLKLGALPSIMDFTKITKICGDYNNAKSNLEADAIVGGVNFSLAISRYESDKEEFFPRSALMEDIRNLVKNASQVLAIFQKPINSTDKYSDIKYVAKGVDIQKINLPEAISSMIELAD